MSKTKSICFVVTGLNMGGAEVQVVLMAKALKARGWAVCVVSMIPPCYFVEELNGVGIDVMSLGMTPGFPSIGALLRLHVFLKKLEPDLVHSHMFHANVLMRIYKVFRRKMLLVSTAHSTDECRGSSFRSFVYSRTSRYSDFTSNVSQLGFERYVREGIIRVDAGRFVPNGLDVDKFRFTTAGRSSLRAELDMGSAFVWLAVGRLQDEKDYPNLISAVASMRKVFDVDFKVLIVGDGPRRSTLVDMVSSLGLESIVKFLGVRRDMPQLFSAVDGFVMSSAMEGTPMVLLEALSCERPVVATDVGGIKALLDGCDAGIVVESGNSLALATAMMRVMAMSEDGRALAGQRARTYVASNFSIDRIADEWEGIYDSFCDDRYLRCR